MSINRTSLNGSDAPRPTLDQIIVNATARMHARQPIDLDELVKAHPEHAQELRELLPALGRRLVTLWVIDEQKDSIKLLKEHVAVFPNCETHVIKNSKHGPDSFGIYESSKIRTTIEANGGLSITMPRLGLGIVTKMYSDRLTISRAIDILPLANRYLLTNFRNACGRAFAPILFR